MLLLAIQFLTRVPIGRSLDQLTPEQVRSGLGRAVIWFPVVGGFIGGATASIILSCELLWPRIVAVVIALIVEARLTGAFHEDAVADFCDGFGGAYGAERIYEIMKDSRIGTYGTLALILAVGLRAALLATLPSIMVLPAIIASAATGRWLAVLAMALIPPFGHATGLAKDIGQKIGLKPAALATVMLMPFLILLATQALTALIAGIAVSLIFLLWFKRLVMTKLGGVTGDCLGFMVYVGQLIILASATASWPI